MVEVCVSLDLRINSSNFIHAMVDVVPRSILILLISNLLHKDENPGKTKSLHNSTISQSMCFRYFNHKSFAENLISARCWKDNRDVDIEKVFVQWCNLKRVFILNDAVLINTSKPWTQSISIVQIIISRLLASWHVFQLLILLQI